MKNTATPASPRHRCHLTFVFPVDRAALRAPSACAREPRSLVAGNSFRSRERAAAERSFAESIAARRGTANSTAPQLVRVTPRGAPLQVGLTRGLWWRPGRRIECVVVDVLPGSG
ncbi:hypothetical protein E2C01_040391 [Portunus trituberculatus]|uniref:Uncharacterized protein n=1 Tax=Portunus trituberculatus TaxID=210409 RepID=A0A5B7FMW7_PORTR|nr:hypothetical protein [Portunus trituberculatus]